MKVHRQIDTSIHLYMYYHQSCHFRKHARTRRARKGRFARSREIEPVPRVLPQARKSHSYGSGTFGAFWRKTGLISLSLYIYIYICMYVY